MIYSLLNYNIIILKFNNIFVLNYIKFSIFAIMNNIIEVDKNFNFETINLENPIPLQGGSFFTKINYTEKNIPLYLQLPKCTSKNGIVTTGNNKKYYIDFLFKYFESDLLSWFENLEIKCRELIFNKKDLWFQSEMDMDDIENMFISPTKSYKSGKYICLRTIIPVTKNIKKKYCIIYDENERILDFDSITENKELIPLIYIEGIKFSSKSFQLEINLPQIMVLNLQENIKNECMIKRSNLKENLAKDEEKYIDNTEISIEENNSNNLAKILENLAEDKKDHKNSVENENLKKLTDDKNSLENENLKKLTDDKKDDKKDDKNSLENENLKKLTDNKKDDKKDDNINIENENHKKYDLVDVLQDNQKDNEEKENFEKQIDNLEEIEINLEDNISDEISLRKPEDVYYEIYKTAREKAKQMKKAALEAYLEAKNIKTKYMLDELNNSDDDFEKITEIEKV